MFYAERLKELRSKNSVSQKSMAELLKTTQQQYSKYEKGLQELPVRHVVTICNEFNVSSDWLLGVENKPIKRRLSPKSARAVRNARRGGLKIREK